MGLIQFAGIYFTILPIIEIDLAFSNDFELKKNIKLYSLHRK